MAEDLIARYRELAASGEYLRGLTILRHRGQLGDLMREHKASSLLDYGCGAGDAWKEPRRLHRQFGLRWFDVRLYDPAFQQHAEKPHGRFDGVLASDVAEHIPEGEVDEFIATLFRHARKFVWASVCTRPAAKTFPGTDINLHVTQRPMEWWTEAFRRHAIAVPFYLVETP